MLQGSSDRVQATKGGRGVVIPSDKGLPGLCHPFDLTADSVPETARPEGERRGGEQNGIEVRLRATIGIEKDREGFQVRRTVL